MRSAPDISVRGPVVIGWFAMLALFLGIASWGSLVPLEGAILASGEVDARPLAYPIRHPQGGTVVRLWVEDGQTVQQNDPLLEISDDRLAQELTLLDEQIAHMTAQHARLSAQAQGREFPALPEHATPVIIAAWNAQRTIFETQRELLESQLRQLEQRGVQATAERIGLTRQSDALRREAELLDEDLRRVRELAARGLVVESRVTTLEREAARAAANQAGIAARIAELEHAHPEIEAQRSALLASARAEIEAQLGALELHLVEARARALILEDEREALILRAPADGQVMGLALAGPGARLRANEPALSIVATPDSPQVRLRVRPDDIESVWIGQSASLRFPAFLDRNTRFEGTVVAIDATSQRDERNGVPFFEAVVHLTRDSLAALRSGPMRPGMSVQAHLIVGRRTAADYVLGPIFAHLDEAFREP